jgi:Uma2 family endonuclease
MSEEGATRLRRERGSVWGPDGLYYPREETRAPEEGPRLSGAAIRLLFYLYGALRHLLYPKHEDVYVAADQLIYYLPHEPSMRVAPDVWVCFGVPKQPERQVFRTWEEGATPSFVIEISSPETRAMDRGERLALYQDALGCQEFLIYDEELDELVLYRRSGDAFELVPPEADGKLYSQEVGARFAREPGILVRVFGPDGEVVLNMKEVYQHAEALERIQTHLQAEAEAARQSAELAAAEAERLRAELARTVKERGE